MLGELKASQWQPHATFEVRRERAAMLRYLRDFFYTRDVLEVETPILSQSTVTDVYIDSFQVPTASGDYYLQTSPEYHMKRLLASGAGSIYQITKAFRHESAGQFHNPEFSMLEWYRPGFDFFDLMREVEALCCGYLGVADARYMTYQAVFEAYVGCNPHECTLSEIQSLIKQQACQCGFVDQMSIDDGLMWLMSEVIEPQLKQEPLVFVYDYPVSQASLAVVSSGVAKRFELYIYGVELANGFLELTDVNIQRERFLRDQEKRRALNQWVPDMDERLLSAMQAGLPNCCGVALGLDRLLQVGMKLGSISETLNFNWHNA